MKLKKAKNSKILQFLTISSYYYLKNSQKTEKIQKKLKKTAFLLLFYVKKRAKKGILLHNLKNSQKQHSAAQLFPNFPNSRDFSFEKIPVMSHCKKCCFWIFSILPKAKFEKIEFCLWQNSIFLNFAFGKIEKIQKQP